MSMHVNSAGGATIARIAVRIYLYTWHLHSHIFVRNILKPADTAMPTHAGGDDDQRVVRKIYSFVLLICSKYLTNSWCVNTLPGGGGQAPYMVRIYFFGKNNDFVNCMLKNNCKYMLKATRMLMTRGATSTGIPSLFEICWKMRVWAMSKMPFKGGWGRRFPPRVCGDYEQPRSGTMPDRSSPMVFIGLRASNEVLKGG